MCSIIKNKYNNGNDSVMAYNLQKKSYFNSYLNSSEKTIIVFNAK
jgi:hypothetical protein